MELIEFRKDYLENIKMNAAAENDGTVSSFVNAILSDLDEMNVIVDYETSYSVGKYGRKSYRVDGYAFDEFDSSMTLVIADFSGNEEIERITKTQANTLFEKLYTFVDGCINGNLQYQEEISTPGYDLIERIVTLKDVIRKFKFFIVTDKEMSEKISKFNLGEINNIPIEYNIWDMNRLYKVMYTGDGHEPVKIDFTKVTENGLPCLEASDVSNDDVKCYLSVIPGEILADIYDMYGSTLLEGNVRSFLSNRGSVNKNIRKTILEADGESKRMFFSYNNGISATAASVDVEESHNGKYIKSISNLQIVNGGQTTASLSNTRYKDKVDLEGIYVQMKLTVIPDSQQAQLLIPKISKGSNSQNKVSEADFFSNHKFIVRIEQISRRMYAPAINGQQYETHWFFERTRGQYEQEQSKMTPGEKKKYKMQNPKDQKITKTELAKYHNTWSLFPYYARLGAQKNFAKFAKLIVDEWNKDESRFNEEYYRELVAVAIMFKAIDKMVSKQDWYEKGYKADIVTYTLSYFRYLIQKQYKDSDFNLDIVWNKQKVPDDVFDEFVKLSKFVFDQITREDRIIKNVTEWCKKEQCWLSLKNQKYKLDDKMESYIISTQDQKQKNAKSKNAQKMISGIQVQAAVIEKGQKYWENALVWGKAHKVINEIEMSFLSAATKLNYGRIPSDKQCQRIVNIEAKLIDEGFKGKR